MARKIHVAVVFGGLANAVAAHFLGEIFAEKDQFLRVEADTRRVGRKDSRPHALL
jgi:hypothetical protein